MLFIIIFLFIFLIFRIQSNNKFFFVYDLLDQQLFLFLKESAFIDLIGILWPQKYILLFNIFSDAEYFMNLFLKGCFVNVGYFFHFFHLFIKYLHYCWNPIFHALHALRVSFLNVIIGCFCWGLEIIKDLRIGIWYLLLVWFFYFL